MDYRREIDGLRALAVLPVILFHAGFETFSGGFVGVDVFFVISGYLITTIILAELEQGKFSIVNFYERRARRILPALFLVMLVCIPFAWFWLLPSDMKDFSKSLVAVSVFASNILFWRESGYFDTAAELKPLLHTWSLAVEEQYYVLFPLFLMLFWKLGKRWILVTLAVVFFVSLAVAQWAAYAKPAAAFYLLPTRGWELLIGAFAAFYLLQANRKEFGKGLSELGGWLGVALILYAVFAYSKATPFPGFYALAPTLGTALIILFATQSTTVGKLVGNKAFVGIGLISYSAYLWHQPLFSFARHLSVVEPSKISFGFLAIASVVLAYFTWRYVERLFRLKNSFTQIQIFKSVVFGLFVFIFVGVIGWRGNLHNDTKAIDYQWGFKVRQHECFLHNVDDYEHAQTCFTTGGNRNVLLWGDSHAASLFPGLDKFADDNSFSLSYLTQSGCPPLHQIETLLHRKNCNEVNQRIIESLSTKNYDTIILHAAWIHPHYPMTQQSLEKKLDSILKIIKSKSPRSRLVVISNVPRWHISAQRAYVLGAKEDGTATYSKAYVLPEIDEVLSRVSLANDADFISLTSLLCKISDSSLPHQDCLIKIGREHGYLAYVDLAHLSDSGALYVIDRIKSQLISTR